MALELSGSVIHGLFYLHLQIQEETMQLYLAVTIPSTIERR